MSEKKEEEDSRPGRPWGLGVATGISIGAGIGVAMENMAIGIAVGIAMGFGFEAINRLKNKN